MPHFHRRKRFSRFVIAGAAVLAVLALLAGPGARPGKRVDLKEWIDGPVHYLSLKEEARAFRKLKNDDERALFIQRFWGRRDPTPNTLANEFRQLFWERVQQANLNFVDSTKPGWKTDRGKIYILYGPPTETQEDPNLRTEGLENAGPGLIRWIYDGRPNGRMDLNPTVVVPFVRDSGGEWRLSYDPKLSSVFFDANAIREGQDKDIEEFLARNNAQRKSQLSVMLDLGRMQEVPPQAQVLLESVETAESYETFALEPAIQRYQEPGTERSVVVTTLDITDSGDGRRPAIVARFAPAQGDQRPRILGEESFKVAESGGRRFAQGRIALEPGSYTVTVLSADPVQVRTGLTRRTLVVPESGDRFRFSDVILADYLESLDYASLSSHTEPFLVGPFRVIPRMNSRYVAGETVRVFFETYNAAYPMQVRYVLEGQDHDGSWVELGQPSVSEQSAAGQGWELPTGERWPEGHYRIRIEVHDAEGRGIETSLPFEIEAASETVAAGGS